MVDPWATSDAELVLDARSRGRYLGTESEPRAGLSSGHIPFSFSLPFTNFLQTNTASDGTKYTTLLPADYLRNALTKSIGVEKTDAVLKGLAPVITSCGSGMTAGVLWLGLKLLGVKQISLYDESWTGYALRPSSRIERA
jgi:thiosulfate/3-mercaptopyruvate sulfurtransferase